VLRGKRHISERPAAVELRQEPGHWEGDTVIGVDKRLSILTLVERRSGFAIIKKLKARTTLEVNAAAINVISEHRKMFRSSPLTTVLSSMITSDLSPDLRSRATLRTRIILGNGDQMRT
jgi:IS30 family transposase